MNKLYLYEILVPAMKDGKEIPIKYHKIWDEKVRAIAGGLTIHKTSKGHWLSPDGEIFVEKMIPIRFMCNDLQIRIISDITAEHYDQKAVMFYRISGEVTVKNYK